MEEIKLCPTEKIDLPAISLLFANQDFDHKLYSQDLLWARILSSRKIFFTISLDSNPIGYISVLGSNIDFYILDTIPMPNVFNNIAVEICDHMFYGLNLNKISIKTTSKVLSRLLLDFGFSLEVKHREALIIGNQKMDVLEYGLLRMEYGI